MDPSFTGLKLSLVETSYSESAQEWTIDIQNAQGQVIKTLTLGSPIEDEEEEQIRWYLEDYVLSDPYQIKRANEAAALLVQYRDRLAKAFQETIREAVSSASQANIRSIRLEVMSQSSTVVFQSLHWELLESANWDIGVDVNVVVTRRIAMPGTEPTAPIFGTDKRVNILFVSARPGADRDVDYRLVSKPLIDLLETHQIQDRCTIEFVRPGSWFFVKNYLLAHPPGYYTIVHFDVHGSLRMNE